MASDELGLIVQRQLAFFEAAPQVGVEPHVFGDPAVHLRREHPMGALAFVFGDVHRRVGRTDQRFEAVAMFRIPRDADRAARVDLDEPERERRAHAIENALRGGFEFVRGAFGARAR